MENVILVTETQVCIVEGSMIGMIFYEKFENDIHLISVNPTTRKMYTRDSEDQDVQYFYTDTSSISLMKLFIQSHPNYYFIGFL